MSDEFWTDQPPMNAFGIGSELLGIDASDGISKTILQSVLLTGLSPPKLLHVKSSSDLTNKFGPDIIIPETETWSLSIDESFDLPKQIQMSAGSVIEYRNGVIENKITYTGTGPMIKLLTPGVACRALLINGVFFTGDGTQPFCDLIGTSRLFINTSRVEGFAGAKTEFPFQIFNNLAAVNWTRGWVFKETSSILISESSLRQSISENVTFLSIISTIPSSVVISGNLPFELKPGDSLLFFDPNGPIDISYNVNNTSITDGNFYQQGTNIVVNSAVIGSLGAEFTEFTTATPHGLKVGYVMVNSEFANPNYNGTFVVVAVDTPLTGTTYEVKALFAISDSGNMNKSSLDQTDVRVTAKDNPGQQNSMTQVEARTSGTVSFQSAIGSFVPLQDTTPTAGDFIQDIATERFTVNTSTGVVTYIGLDPITIPVRFELNINRDGGSTDIATLSLFKNTAQQTKTDNILSITATTQKVTYSGGLISMANGDTFQLKLNSDSASIINVSELTMLMIQ